MEVEIGHYPHLPSRDYDAPHAQGQGIRDIMGDEDQRHTIFERARAMRM